MARRRKSIDEYRERRDFEHTPEPPPGKPPPSDGEPRFVVQRHEARRLHYDLRLEIGGALASWAVPKGFTYAPKERRLAIRTEDHPLAYLDFEGVIPAGQYGAGTMGIWDRGRFRLLNADDVGTAIGAGKLDLLFRGRKLRGEFHLFRIDERNDEWLLIKRRDRYAHGGDDPVLTVDFSLAAERAPPKKLLPMRPSRECAPFSDPGWLFEVEFAGERLLVEKRGDEVRLRRRGGAGAGGGPLAALVRDLAELRAEEAVLDGMLVAPDATERPCLETLRARLAGTVEGPLLYQAFDLLFLEGWDLRRLPLKDRKVALASVVPELAHVHFVDAIRERGEELCEAVRTAGLPAVIAKDAASTYRGGAAAAWRRIPTAVGSEEVQIGVREALEQSGAGGKATRRRLRFTNRSKELWPGEGITKGDLIEYYERVAPVLLPHLRDRPLHLHRHPDGIEGESFFQKEAPARHPSWIRTEVIPTEQSGKPIRYVVCTEVSTLLYLANLGSIDLHPWMSRLDALDSPDYTVLDLDPKGAPFAKVVAVARALGRLLRGIGLRPLLKTSGSTGLHLFVPLRRGYGYQQSRMFAETVARCVVRELPDVATVERAVSRRGGRVYVDYGQNRKAQTVVPPYVVRPVPGATVSAPLDWDELDAGVQLADFTLRTMPERIERRGDLFAPVLTDGHDLAPAIEALEQLLRG